MKKTMVVRMFGRLIVLRESAHPPLDAEWDEFLALLSANRSRLEELRILVLTDGGGPDRGQRNRLERTLDGKTVRVAVVSDSAKVRFIASAIALLNRDHRGFGTKEIGEAYAYLGLNTAEKAFVERSMSEMTAQLA